MIFNPNMNKVTLDQSIQWVTKGFKEIVKNYRLFGLNVMSVFVITSCIDLFSARMPVLNVLYVMYFCILGTVILNLYNSRNRQDHLISLFAGFRPPYVRRLMTSGILFCIGFIVTLIVSMIFLYYKGFFNQENIEQLQMVTERLSSPATLKQLEEVISNMGAKQFDFGAFREIFPNVDLGKIAMLTQQLVIAIEIFLIIFLIVFCYFWLVPYFCTLCYEDLKYKRINMYALSFKAAFSLKNILPLFSFGISLCVIIVLYNFLLMEVINSVSNMPVRILLEDLKDAVSSCFMLYSGYFMFLDLFSNHEEEKQEVAAQNISDKNKMAANVEVKKL